MLTKFVIIECRNISSFIKTVYGGRIEVKSWASLSVITAMAGYWQVSAVRQPSRIASCPTTIHMESSIFQLHWLTRQHVRDDEDRGKRIRSSFYANGYEANFVPRYPWHNTSQNSRPCLRGTSRNQNGVQFSAFARCMRQLQVFSAVANKPNSTLRSQIRKLKNTIDESETAMNQKWAQPHAGKMKGVSPGCKCWFFTRFLIVHCYRFQVVRIPSPELYLTFFSSTGGYDSWNLSLLNQLAPVSQFLCRSRALELYCAHAIWIDWFIIGCGLFYK